MADNNKQNLNADDVLDLDPTSFVDDVYNAVCVGFCWFLLQYSCCRDDPSIIPHVSKTPCLERVSSVMIGLV